MAIIDKLRAMIRHQGGSVEGVDTIEKAFKELDKIEANPLSGLLVDASIAAATDLLGKYVADLESDIAVTNGAITGTLNYVTGYTGFSGVEAEQEGNYLALYCRVPGVDGVTIKTEVIGNNGHEATLDPDGIIIARIKEETVAGKTFVVTASKEGYADVKKVFSLENLVCTQKPAES